MLVHINEQKVTSLSAAAVLADMFVLTHKVTFPSPIDKSRSVSVTPSISRKTYAAVAATKHLLRVEMKESVIATKPTI